MKTRPANIQLRRWAPRFAADALLVPVTLTDGRPRPPQLSGASETLNAVLRELCRAYHGDKSVGASDDTIAPAGTGFSRVALICLGEKKNVSAADVRRAAGAAAGWCERHRVRRAAVANEALETCAGADAISPWVEGTLLGTYKFHELRSKKPDSAGFVLDELTLLTPGAPSRSDEQHVVRAVRITEAVNLARTVGHLPPNVINPVSLARRCREVAKKYRLRFSVLDDRQMKARGMGAILAVGCGSASKPRMIVLEHAGGKSGDRPVVLVGKAVTLDTGGYSIKPAASIPDMKYDKCGGMAVLGTMVAAALLKLPRRVVGIIGAAENMISGEAYRPGDIVTAASGTTIEIVNTDAEGRLVLADCLHHAQKAYDPVALIDLATLTGACEVALGGACAGLMANDDKLADTLLQSGERTDERLWRLPLWPVYRELITGGDGDIKNSGGRPAGAISAAMFLKEFVADKTPWAHLDIAGVANVEKATPICPVGATGFGVRLLVDYLQSQH